METFGRLGMLLFSVCLAACGRGTGVYVEGVRVERTPESAVEVSFMIFNSGNRPARGRAVECRLLDAGGRAVAERRVTVAEIDPRSAIRQSCAFEKLPAADVAALKPVVQVL